MVNKYPPESSTPNWPIQLNPKNFDRYCGPVFDAVNRGIDRVLNQIKEDFPMRILSNAELVELRQTWLEKNKP